jgi:hypothetical protein
MEQSEKIIEAKHSAEQLAVDLDLALTAASHQAREEYLAVAKNTLSCVSRLIEEAKLL